MSYSLCNHWGHTDLFCSLYEKPPYRVVNKVTGTSNCMLTLTSTPGLTAVQITGVICDISKQSHVLVSIGVRLKTLFSFQGHSGKANQLRLLMRFGIQLVCNPPPELCLQTLQGIPLRVNPETVHKDSCSPSQTLKVPKPLSLNGNNMLALTKYHICSPLSVCSSMM